MDGGAKELAEASNAAMAKVTRYMVVEVSVVGCCVSYKCTGKIFLVMNFVCMCVNCWTT